MATPHVFFLAIRLPRLAITTEGGRCPLHQPGGTRMTAAARGAAPHSFGWWLAGSLLLGIGTAMVYPTLIAAVSDASHPSWRARALSVYRFWRDIGYAIGALSAGIIADLFGFAWAIAVAGAFTFLSGAVVAVTMRECRLDGRSSLT